MALIQVATWPETFSLVWFDTLACANIGLRYLCWCPMGCPFWNDLLFDKEIQSSSGANLRNTLQGRPNLLVGEVTHSHADVWKAIEFVPPGCSGESIAKDFLTWDECMPLSEITLLWNAKGIKPRHRGFFWCLAARSSDFGEVLTMRLTMKPRSFQLNRTEKIVCTCFLSLEGVLEDGPMAWSTSVHIMESKPKLWQLSQTWPHVPHMLPTIDVPVINGYVSLPVDVLSHMSQGCVIHGSVLSNNWIAAAAKWHPHGPDH